MRSLGIGSSHLLCFVDIACKDQIKIVDFLTASYIQKGAIRSHTQLDSQQFSTDTQ